MSPPPDVHEWVSFSDSDGDSWLFDVTFMVSNYMCIYGCGCPGVFTELAPEYEHGCCTYGAHLVDDDDRELVLRRAQHLSAEEWQLKDQVAETGGPIIQTDEGEWMTQTIDDACVFLNRPGHPSGAGCALHQAALSRGDRPIDWKPDVCWQVPIRFDDFTDDNGHTTYIVREWKRRDWGEGGSEFAWWCTDDRLAFVGDRPVWRSLRDELVELVGEEPYRMLVDYLSERSNAEFLAHPRLRMQG